jgi:hypothetical protein
MKSSHSAHRAQEDVNNAPVPVSAVWGQNNVFLNSYHTRRYREGGVPVISLFFRLVGLEKCSHVNKDVDGGRERREREREGLNATVRDQGGHGSCRKRREQRER